MKAIAFVLAGVLVLGACDLITGADEGFSVRADDGDLVLTNRLDETVGYYALKEGMSGVIDLLPGAFHTVAAGEQARLPFEAIIGYEPGTEQARVVWSTEGDDDSEYIVVDL